MMAGWEDTIAAVATPIGEGGIGIVRVSGKESLAIARKIFKPRHPQFSWELAESQRLYYGHIVDPEGCVVDEVMLVFFAAPRSYTTEAMVEIHGHGGSASLRAVLELVLRSGARMAEPGEFTKRAFLGGRIDLTQAEAVLDTIRAKTDLALKAAMRQLEGSLSKEIHALKDGLMAMYAHMEAALDFPEDDLDTYSKKEFHERFQSAEAKMKTLLASFEKGALIREGALAVIVGKPNVGKSSILNALLARERAIVSDIPGTTRDVIEETIEIGGLPVRVADTAGLFVSEEPLTKAGMEKTRQYVESGDLFLLVLDAQAGVSEEDATIFSELGGKSVLPVVNKIDVAGGTEKVKRAFESGTRLNLPSAPCFVSAKTLEGIEALEHVILERLAGGRIEAESIALTRLRHKRSLEEAKKALEESREAFCEKRSLEFVTLDLKRALDALGTVVGEIYTDDLLDVIFKEFCIGK